MLTRKQIKLLKTLPFDGTPMTAASIATAMGVSLRSVKSYVAELIRDHHGLISSTAKGYSVSSNKLVPLLYKEEKELTPSTSEGRVRYIINALLESDEPLDLFDLEEKLFVSTETVRKDLGLVRSQLKNYALFLEPKDNTIRLGGEELNKRKMQSDMLFQEFNRNILSLNAMSSAFPSYDVRALKAMLVEVCNEHHYFINEYALNSLMLYLMISIDRMRSNGLQQSSSQIYSRLGTEDRAVACGIVARMESIYNVKFNEYELDELSILLFGYLTRINYKNLTMENIAEAVGSRCMAVIHKVNAELDSTRLLDTKNEELMLRFIVHIYNLIHRLEGSYSTKNPLTEHLKVSCPSIFELAVMVADIIQQETGYYVGENETASLALHIGSMLEVQQSMRNQVTCLIIYPEFYNLAGKMASQLADTFDSELIVKGVATSEEESLQFGAVDLVISTMVLENFSENAITLSPFLTERDISAVRSTIDHIKRRKRKDRLKETLYSISGSSLFVRNQSFNNEEEAIRFMAGELEKENSVDARYVESVLERERSYSTAYGLVAVPHSMKMTAKRTRMYTMLNKKGISWGAGKVNIILMFSISPEDRAKFYEVFDNLIVLLLEPQNAHKIIECDSYELFADTILQLFESSN
jgi:lichenan operon transcriptional antiterminator